MALTAEQLRFIDSVASLGTAKLATDNLEIPYTQYKEWIDNEEFMEEINKAKQYFNEGITETITVLAKRELMKIMINGIVELSTNYKTICNAEGEVIGSERNVKRVYKGVPHWALKEALKLIPEIQNLVEGLNAYNSLPADTLENVKFASQEYEKQLRAALKGKEQAQTITSDEMIAAIQQTLIGG